MKRINAALLFSLCAAMFADCGGGGAGVGTSTLLPQSRSRVLMTQSTKSAGGNVRFAIGIKPKPKTGQITPQYVSPSTRSLQILTDGANPVIINLTPRSPNCSPNPKVPGSYICTASLNVPTGNHVFTVTTYDLTGGTGNVLSTNTTGTVFVKATGETTVSIVLEGAVHYVILTLACKGPPAGTPATIGVTPTLEDADQNLIVGPAPYEYPVTLTATDSTDGPLSKTTLNSPADTVGITVSYTGAKVASITYSATATGLPPANVSNTVLTPGARQLYVANFNNTVSVFDLADLSAPPTKITGGGLSCPSGAAVDASGRLYVADSAKCTSGRADHISIFDTTHGNAVLPPISTLPLEQPEGVAIDASGKLYVAIPFANTISVFDTTHANAVLPAIAGGGLNRPLGVTVDASGKLYAENTGVSSVSVFDTEHGNAVLPTITGGGLYFPQGAAIDASGKLYVANSHNSNDNSDSISVFDTAHGNAVLPAIKGGGLSHPWGVAVDACNGLLYVTNTSPNSISVFDTAHGNAALPAITGGGLSDPQGVAIR